MTPSRLGTIIPAVANIEDNTMVPLFNAFIPQSELIVKNRPEQEAIAIVVKSNPLNSDVSANIAKSAVDGLYQLFAAILYVPGHIIPTA